MFETVDQRAQDCQLPVQAHRHPAHAADRLAVNASRIDQDAFLDAVELPGEVFGISVERLDNLPGDGLEQRRRASQFEAVAKRPARGLDGVQLMPAAGDEQALRGGKMQKADLLGDAVKPANEIGKHAVNAGAMAVQLLMLFGGKEKRARRRRQARARR